MGSVTHHFSDGNMPRGDRSRNRSGPPFRGRSQGLARSTPGCLIRPTLRGHASRRGWRGLLPRTSPGTPCHCGRSTALRVPFGTAPRSLRINPAGALIFSTVRLRPKPGCAARAHLLDPDALKTHRLHRVDIDGLGVAVSRRDALHPASAGDELRGSPLCLLLQGRASTCSARCPVRSGLPKSTNRGETTRSRESRSGGRG